MRSSTRQFEVKSWPICTGPIVVFAYEKNTMKKLLKIAAGRISVHSRDGPIIFHTRDGPPHVTGPPGGTGPPPRFSSESGPPKTTGPPMEWLLRKKSLKKH